MDYSLAPPDRNRRADSLAPTADTTGIEHDVAQLQDVRVAHLLNAECRRDGDASRVSTWSPTRSTQPTRAAHATVTLMIRRRRCSGLCPGSHSPIASPMVVRPNVVPAVGWRSSDLGLRRLEARKSRGLTRRKPGRSG